MAEYVSGYRLICHNLHLFLEIPELIQAIQNGITVWKGMGSALVMISPLIQLKPEIEKFLQSWICRYQTTKT
jgi:hypothetical protein